MNSTSESLGITLVGIHAWFLKFLLLGIDPSSLNLSLSEGHFGTNDFQHMVLLSTHPSIHTSLDPFIHRPTQKSFLTNGLGSDFLDMIPKAQMTREKNRQME